MKNAFRGMIYPVEKVFGLVDLVGKVCLAGSVSLPGLAIKFLNF